MVLTFHQFRGENFFPEKLILNKAAMRTLLLLTCVVAGCLAFDPPEEPHSDGHEHPPHGEHRPVRPTSPRPLPSSSTTATPGASGRRHHPPPRPDFSILHRPDPFLNASLVAHHKRPAGERHTAHHCDTDLQCAEPCPDGFLLDHATGCHTCECHVNPCKDLACEGDLRCHPKNCRMEDCTLERFKCVSAEEYEPLVRCPRPMCTTPCTHGYARDLDGCPSCECSHNPCINNTCTQGTGCHPLNCHAADCSSDKKYDCIAPTRQCRERECSAPCEHGYQTDRAGCQTCSCRTAPTPPPVNVQDYDSLCKYNQDLMARLQDTPLPEEAKRHLSPHLECAEDGAFLPRQCHTNSPDCWCVDDRGMELEGSRVDTNTSPQPECEEHLTQNIEMEMILHHEYENLDEHLQLIKEAVSAHLSEWLSLEEKNIEVFEVLPHDTKVQAVRVDVTLHRGHGDLNLAAQKFMVDATHTAHVIQCPGGGQLTVDTHYMRLQHRTTPVTDEDTLRRLKEAKSGKHHKEEKSFAVAHLALGLGALGLLVVCIVLMLVACRMCMKKRNASAQFRHNKMDKYTENLAFENDKGKIAVVKIDTPEKF